MSLPTFNTEKMTPPTHRFVIVIAKEMLFGGLHIELIVKLSIE